ncbi:MAG: hypothetical protein QNK03_10360 [Myxococcota bacterium]|nr:hypothetical protein [Myxococcota bacterium]
MLRRAPALALALALLALPLLAPADEEEETVIYKWIDQHGIAHYTTDPERIPESIRNRVHQLRRPPPRETAGDPARSRWENPDRRAPAARAAPPGATASTAPPADGTPPTTASAPSSPASAEGARSEPQASEVPKTETVLAPSPAQETWRDGSEPPAPRPPARRVRAIDDERWAVRDIPPKPARKPGELPDFGPGATDPAVEEEIAEIDAEIAAIEGSIAQDEEALLALISVLASDRDGVLADDPQFREIAQRLPQLEADLRQLRERRAALEPESATP